MNAPMLMSRQPIGVSGSSLQLPIDGLAPRRRKVRESLERRPFWSDGGNDRRGPPPPAICAVMHRMTDLSISARDVRTDGRLRQWFLSIIEESEEDTFKKLLIVGALTFAASSIAQTASAQEVDVVRDATTKIVDTKPTTTTTTIVDNGTFKTRTEAETGMKTMKVCTTN